MRDANGTAHTVHPAPRKAQLKGWVDGAEISVIAIQSVDSVITGDWVASANSQTVTSDDANIGRIKPLCNTHGDTYP